MRMETVEDAGITTSLGSGGGGGAGGAVGTTLGGAVGAAFASITFGGDGTLSALWTGSCGGASAGAGFVLRAAEVAVEVLGDGVAAGGSFSGGVWIAAPGSLATPAEGASPTFIWSFTFVTPAVCVASLNASKRADALGTTPLSVTSPLADVTFSVAPFNCGSENISDWILATMAASSAFFAQPMAKKMENTATASTTLWPMSFFSVLKSALTQRTPRALRGHPKLVLASVLRCSRPLKCCIGNVLALEREALAGRPSFHNFLSRNSCNFSRTYGFHFEQQYGAWPRVIISS